MLRKIEPISDGGQQEERCTLPRSPRWMAERARTIVTDEQIRMKVLTAVRSMLRGLVSVVVGHGPVVGLERLDLGLGAGGLAARSCERRRPSAGVRPADDRVRGRLDRACSACSAVEAGRRCRIDLGDLLVVACRPTVER